MKVKHNRQLKVRYKFKYLNFMVNYCCAFAEISLAHWLENGFSLSIFHQRDMVDL